MESSRFDKSDKSIREVSTSVEFEIDRAIELEAFLEIAKTAYLKSGCPPCGRNSMIFKFRDPVINPASMKGLLQSREIIHSGIAQVEEF